MLNLIPLLCFEESRLEQSRSYICQYGTTASLHATLFSLALHFWFKLQSIEVHTSLSSSTSTLLSSDSFFVLELEKKKKEKRIIL